MPHSLGTHNLHDEAGRVTLFADAILFTEAIPTRVRDKVRAASSRARARASGRRVVVCRQQRDLVVVLRRRLWKVTGVTYTPVIGRGEKYEPQAGVTPHRGTFVVLTTWRGKRNKGRRPRAFVVEHRINAAFPPYIRGEAQFRRDAWHAHAAATRELIRRLLDSGYEVDAGGDVNTPEDVDAYAGLARLYPEVGQHFDRLVSSDHLDMVAQLSREGSDHPRLRARVTP